MFDRGDREPRQGKALIATLLGALALFAAGQALLPGTAAAMDGDETEDVCTLEGEPDIDIGSDPQVCEGEGEGGDGSGDGGTSEPPSDGGVSDAPSDGNEEVVVIWEPGYPGRPEPNPAVPSTPADGKTRPRPGDRSPGSWEDPGKVKAREWKASECRRLRHQIAEINIRDNMNALNKLEGLRGYIRFWLQGGRSNPGLLRDLLEEAEKVGCLWAKQAPRGLLGN